MRRDLRKSEFASFLSLAFFCIFFRKKSPKVTMTAKNNRDPITVPAIALIGTPSLFVVAAGGAVSSLLEEVEVLDGPEVDVAVVALVVEDGDWLFRHEEASLAPTVSRSDAPPAPPRPSVIINIMEVPAATLAVQL